MYSLNQYSWSKDLWLGDPISFKMSYKLDIYKLSLMYNSPLSTEELSQQKAAWIPCETWRSSYDQNQRRRAKVKDGSTAIKNV